MSGIYNNLAKITDIKNDIKQSIANKGIDMTDVPFADYPEKIDEIVVNGDYQIGYDAGRAYQKSLLIPFTITQNGTYERQNGYSKVIVNIEDNDGDYQQGYTDGYSKGSLDGYENGFGIGEEYGYNNGVAVGKEQQKSLLQPISITENGIYQTENGYSEVNVNVPSGGIDKVRVADGLKFAYSTFEEIPSYFDFDGVDDLSYMFYNSSLKICPDLSMVNIDYLTLTFAKCGYLHTIPLLDCSNVEGTYNFLENCSSLVNVGGFLNMKASFDLPDAQNLTNESFLNIINTIYDYTANNETPPQYGYASIYMSEYMQNKFNNYIHLITQKGWTVLTGF